MVICCAVGCTNKPDKDSPVRFYHIPRIQSKHGEYSLVVSTERRNKWFSASKRSDINVNALHHIVWSVDFVSRKPAAYLKHQYISLLQDEMNNISAELCKLRLEDWFNSEEKVNFYTGLPNVLMTVFEFVSSGMKHSSLSALIQFQEFTMTLMRLRLNLTIADLACRFASTTSVVILKWIDIAYNRLEVMLKWPS